MNELKVIMQDIENVYHQLGAVLRDLDMIHSDQDSDSVHLANCCNPTCTWIDNDPSNVDTDPPDEYNVDPVEYRGADYGDDSDHACNTTVDGG